MGAQDEGLDGLWSCDQHATELDIDAKGLFDCDGVGAELEAALIEFHPAREVCSVLVLWEVAAIGRDRGFDVSQPGDAASEANDVRTSGVAVLVRPDPGDAIFSSAEVPFLTERLFRPEKAFVAIEVLGNTLPVGQEVIRQIDLLATDVVFAGGVDCRPSFRCCFSCARVIEIPCLEPLIGFGSCCFSENGSYRRVDPIGVISGPVMPNPVDFESGRRLHIGIDFLECN